MGTHIVENENVRTLGLQSDEIRLFFRSNSLDYFYLLIYFTLLY